MALPADSCFAGLQKLTILAESLADILQVLENTGHLRHLVVTNVHCLNDLSCLNSLQLRSLQLDCNGSIHSLHGTELVTLTGLSS